MDYHSQSSTHRTQRLAAVAVALGLLLSFAFASAGMAQAPADDQGLLDELTGDLFDGLEKEVRQAPKKNAPKVGAPGQEDGEPEKPIPDQVPLPGEDIGEASNPLLEIGRLMQQVERRLDEQDAGQQTQQEQQAILDQLARLIEQSQQSSGNADGQQGSQQSTSQQPTASQSKMPQDGQGNQPAQAPSSNPGDGNRAPGQNPMDSDKEIREASVEGSEARLRSELIRDTWGHLPQHVREAMLNVPSGEYLPQYAPLIEQYFKRLAEQYRSTP